MPSKDLTVQIAATTAQYEKALERAARTTYNLETSVIGAQAAVAKLELEMNREATQAAAKMAKAQEAAAKRKTAAASSLGKALLGAGLAADAGMAMAVKAFADFDKRMSSVQSLSHATAKDMQSLRTAALTLGQGIGFSASQVADAETELVKAGVSVKDMLGGGLKGALDLAAAGQIDVAQATQVAAAAMTEFKLSGQDVPHIADLLAAGADKALGGVDDLGLALRQSGLVAAQFGLSIDETVGSLSAFAQAGLLGQDAGTSFKQMLLALAKPSAQAATTMSDLGIAAYDSQGKFVGITALAGQLHEKLSGLSQAQRDAALATIFGSDAIRAANVLYNQGADGIREWTAKVNDQGFAAQQAAGKMDNLAGDLTKLKAAVENAFIGVGSQANGPLRGLTQEATAAVTAFGQLPEPVQTAAAAVLSISGIAGTAAGAFLLLLPKVREGVTAFKELKVASVASRMIFSPWGLAAAGVVTAVALIAKSHMDAAQRVQDFTSAIQADTGALGENARAAVASELQKQGVLDAARKLGLSLSDVTDAALGNADAFGRVDGRLKDIRGAYAAVDASGAVFADTADDTGTAMSKVSDAISGTNKELADAKRKFDELQQAQGAALVSANSTVNAYDAMHGTVARATDDTAALSNGLGSLGALMMQAQGDTGRLTDAQKQLADAIEGSVDPVKALNDATDKGKVSLSHWGDELAKQVKAATDFKDNLARLAATGHEDLAREFASMGADGQVLAAQAVQASGKELDKLSGVVSDAAGLAGEQWDQGLSILAAISSSKGKITIEQLAKQFTGGSVDDIISVLEQIKTGMGNIPESKQLDVILKAAKADQELRQLNALAQQLGAQSPTISVSIAGYSTVMTQLGRLKAETSFGQSFAVSPFRHAGGGYISGPGTGTSDSIPALVSNGEYVVRASAVRKVGVSALDRINRFADGGLVGYAAGGRVTAPNPGLLRSIDANAAWGSVAGRSAQQIQASIDAVTRLAAAWKLAMDAADQAGKRAQLVKDLAKASGADQIREARAALTDFDRQSAIDAAQRRVDAQQDTLAARQKLAANREAWAFDHLSTQKQLADVQRRIKAEKQYSDTWMDLAKQREQLQQQLVSERQSTADGLFSQLNSALDEQARITEELAQAQATYQKAIGDANKRLREQTEQLKESRAEALEGWAQLGDKVEKGFAPSIGYLVANAKAQVQQFTAWMEQLDLARRRGLSESAISALGLDRGPQALAQLEQINKGTAGDVDALNAVVAQRNALARQQADREAAGMLGDLGKQLFAAQQEAAQAIADAQAEFLATQQRLEAELAQIGTDQARSYTDAITQGLQSGLPAVIALARQFAAALASAQAAASSMAAMSSDPSKTKAAAAKLAQSRMSARTKTYDVGGALMPGWTLAYNGTGRVEHVLTGAQMSQLSGGGDVFVEVGLSSKTIAGIADVQITRRSRGEQLARRGQVNA